MKSKLLSLKKIKNEYSSLVLMAPYTFLFILFIIIPVGAAIILSFTSFNAIGAPSFTGLSNYVNLLTNDSVFMQKVLPNTLIYAIFVGLGGYVLSFFLAWSLSQIPKIPRTIMTVILYSPSVTGGVLLATIWSSVFSGDKSPRHPAGRCPQPGTCPARAGGAGRRICRWPRRPWQHRCSGRCGRTSRPLDRGRGASASRSPGWSSRPR